MKMRSRRRKPLEIDLLPFLSVLSCTIGSLILLVVVISTSAVGDKRTVKILPLDDRGNNGTRIPQYIECSSSGARLHQWNTLIPESELTENRRLVSYLSELAQTRSEYVIVAIRPDGYSCFETVRREVEKARLDIGFEPVNENWTLEVE